MDEPYYVGFKVDGQDVGLDPNGHSKGMTGPVGLLARRRHQGEPQGAPRRRRGGAAGVNDVGGGKLIASVKDADGNVIGLRQ